MKEDEIMEFMTLIKKDHEIKRWNCLNDYVVGTIRGIQYVICHEPGESEFAHIRINEGLILTTDCTKEQYQHFSDIVEELYPGLCEFYYTKDEEEV